MAVGTASDTAVRYVRTLVKAGLNFTRLHNIVTKSPQSQSYQTTLHSHLLDNLRRYVTFDKHPKTLSESHLETHLATLVHFSLDYWGRAPPQLPETMGKEKQVVPPPPPPPPCCVPVGGNTTNQLPQRHYILVSVSVDTVPLTDGRQVIWHISVHIPSLSEEPDYECLMLPQALLDSQSDMLFHLGFEPGIFHQGIEFGRRRADSEEVGLEKFVNYLDEIRSGLHGAGPNNGLILLFEMGEDLALVQQLLSYHHHYIFLDIVKGIACMDHYLRVTQSVRPAANSWPKYQYRVGEGGRWTARIFSATPRRIEAETKPECVYNICKSLLGTPPGFDNFIKWYSYPVNHSEINRMSSSLEYILELLPLQKNIAQQLHMSQISVVLEGLYEPRSEVEVERPYNTCALQTIRRLVSLGFTLNVLKKIFWLDPTYEIPSCIFLQNMSEVQKLRVHSQTNMIRHIIQQYFVNPSHIKVGPFSVI